MCWHLNSEFVKNVYDVLFSNINGLQIYREYPIKDYST